MTTAAVDLTHLARYTGGDVALNAEILRLFDSQATELVDRLQTILAARDAKSWKEVTHTLKGAARGIGAFGLGGCCRCGRARRSFRGQPNGRSGAGSAAVADRCGSGFHQGLSGRLTLKGFFPTSPRDAMHLAE
ncbi:MAG: Hpt domain-containing protein [Rhizomicrobium sp.]